MLTVISIFLGFYAGQVTVNVSARGLMGNEEGSLDYYNRVTEIFGSDDITIVYVRDEDLFNYEKLSQLYSLFEELDNLEYVERVESLFNTKNFKDDAGWLSTSPFLEEIPRDKEKLNAIKKDALNSQLVHRNLISKDGNSLALNLYMKSGHDIPNFDKKASEAIENIISDYASEYETIFQIGLPFVRNRLAEQVIGDLLRLIPLALVILIFTILFFVRSINAAIIPIITSLLSIIWALGFMALMDIPLNMLTGIIPVILIVIGSTEDIHIINEFQEAYLETGDRKKSLNILGNKLGIALFLTFLTTFLGFFSIYFNQIHILKQFGLASAFALFANFFITVHFDPIYLQRFGQKSARGSSDKGIYIFDRAGDFFLSVIEKRSFWIVLVSAVLMLVMLFGIYKIRVDNDLLSYFKKSSEVRQRNDILASDFAGMQTFYIVLEPSEPQAYKNPQYLRQLQQIQQHLEEDPAFDLSLSIADYIAKVNQEMHGGDEEEYRIPDNSALISQYYLFFHENNISRYVNYSRDKALIMVRHHIRGSYLLNSKIEKLQKWLEKSKPCAEINLTGENILVARAADTIARGQAWSLLLLVLVIFVLMSVLFTNIKAGILSLMPNLFPIAVLFGIMGYTGMYLDTGTAMIGAIAIGIALDDTIHLMVRYHGEMNRTKDQKKAMETTLHQEIVPVLSSTVATALGFSILMFSSFLPIIKFGLLTGLAMFLALIADLLLTPVLLRATRLLTLWDILSVELKEEVFQHASVFEGLSKWSIRKIILLGEVDEIENGKNLVRKGERGTEMFLILEGKASVELPGEQRKEIAHLQPGDIFGEVGLLTPCERSADVVALTDVKVLKLEWESLVRIQRYLPYVSSRLFLNISRILGTRLADVL